MLPVVAFVAAAGGIALNTYQEWNARRPLRKAYYDLALARARAVGKPLLVVGDPDGGLTHGDYGYGDLCIDMTGCPNAPRGMRVDLCEGIPLPTDSHVVFVCYVLEVCPDVHKAFAEVARVAGKPEDLFVLALHPSEIAAYSYPGTKWLIHSAPPNGEFHAEPIVRKQVVAR